MRVCLESAHICTNDRNDSLGACISNASYILYNLGSLLLFRLHEVIDLIVQIFDVDVKFVQMGKQFLHHPALQWCHDTIEIIDDLLFAGLEIMGNDLLLIHLIIFSIVDAFAGEQIFQNTAGAFPVDIGNSPDSLMFAPSSIF